MKRLLGALAALCLTVPAQAKPAPEFDGDRWVRTAQGASTSTAAREIARPRRTHQRARKWQRRPVPRPGTVAPVGMFRADRGAIIGGRPAGCPHRFCGCALSLHLFGRIIPNLNLAANWRHAFPGASAAPGMVAVRPGHVFKLIADRGYDKRGRKVWEVWDANSGRGRIRIHNRSIAGYAIVNPHRRRA